MKPTQLPLFQVMVFAAIMFCINVLFPAWHISVASQTVIAVIVFVTGVGIILVGGYQFKKLNTTVNPLNPEATTVIVKSGLYRYSRNPMYIGFFLFLLAWGIYLGSLPALFALPVFIWYITDIQIKPEEKILENKFGEDYKLYASSVRRWL